MKKAKIQHHGKSGATHVTLSSSGSLSIEIDDWSDHAQSSLGGDSESTLSVSSASTKAFAKYLGVKPAKIVEAIVARFSSGFDIATTLDAQGIAYSRSPY